MAEVRLRIGEQELVSIITRGSAERLRLRAGDEVIAVIKSTEVMIGKGAGRSHDPTLWRRRAGFVSSAALPAAGLGAGPARPSR